jgi:hypothetical protein
VARFLATLILVLVLPSPARAVDAFEIQVYEGDADEPGQAGLELHSNYTASGRQQPVFAGEVVPNGLLRMTLEPSYGLFSWWELGAYLQTATDGGGPHWAGFKLRSKFIAPGARTAPFVVGVNLELGRGVAALGTDSWDVEMRPIIALTRGRFAVAFNPILGWSLTGGDRHAAPEFEPALKARADVGHRIALGIEYYASFGYLSSPAAWHDQEHYVYVVADLVGGPIELNVAVGRGLTDTSDAWTIKTIIGKTF